MLRECLKVGGCAGLFTAIWIWGMGYEDSWLLAVAGIVIMIACTVAYVAVGKEQARPPL